MSEQPLVSIILPAYNRARYVRRSIESVLTQTYKNFELIIIDDGSTDETPEMISGLAQKDFRIRVVSNKTNLGFVKTLNKGIGIARGKYIARIDDDDFWCDTQKLEKQVAFLEDHPDYALVGGCVIRINEQGKEIVRLMLPKTDKEVREAILQNNPFVHSAVVFRKEAWERAGGYDEAVAFPNEDWDLWMKFGGLGKFYNFQRYFVKYLYGGQNYSVVNIRKNFKSAMALRKKYRDDYPGFITAYLFGWAYWLFSFIPFQKRLHPLLIYLRGIALRNSSYKSFRSKN